MEDERGAAATTGPALAGWPATRAVVLRFDAGAGYVPAHADVAALAELLDADSVTLFGPQVRRGCRIRRSCREPATYGDLCRGHHFTEVVYPQMGEPEVTADMPRPGWSDQAVCYELCASGELDPDLFHPSRGDNGRPHPDVIAACSACPVRGDCVLSAIRARKEERMGFWGGMTVNQRKQFARRLARRGIDTAPVDSYGKRAALPD